MLIKLDDSLYTYLKENNENKTDYSNVIQALNNLALAYRSGWHILIGPLELLEILSDIEELDNTSKGVFKTLVNQYAYQKSYIDLIQEYIVIKSPDCRFKRLTNSIFEIPITYFTDLNKILETALLCEDTSDYDFYMKLVDKYINQNKNILNIGIRLRAENGGGANSYRVFKKLIDRNQITLAIADSDRKYPESSPGETINRLKDVYDSYKDSKIIDLIELEVKEKENLIPPSLYYISANNSYKQIIKLLMKAEKFCHLQEKLLYFDIKSGYKAKHFKKDPDLFEYYRELFEVTSLVSTSIEEIENKDDEEPVFSGVSSILNPFIEKVLDNGLEKELDRKSKIKEIPNEVIQELKAHIEITKKIFDYFPNRYQPIINNLCKKIIAWGCSRKEHLST